VVTKQHYAPCAVNDEKYTVGVGYYDHDVLLIADSGASKERNKSKYSILS